MVKWLALLKFMYIDFYFQKKINIIKLYKYIKEL